MHIPPLPRKWEQAKMTRMCNQTNDGALRSHGSHNNSKKLSQYKLEALDRRYDEIWGNHAGLVERLHDFQTKKFEDRQSIGKLNYESKRCWKNLADQCIFEAALTIRTEMYTSSEFLGARLGVG
jgi:hypothetical protein